ncbi:MAG: 5'-nucleotidase C-terminal domain-containing protein, partial [Gemmatimonadales bacterium]|nr:5'-nucleotidase C-terminal domain-containing protein [Gemmatimonadales bacterium]
SVIAGVHFVQPPPFARGVSVVHLDLVRQTGRWRLTAVRAELIPTTETPASVRVAARLKPRDAAVRDWADSTLGTSLAPMRAAAARAEPTDLIDFVNAVQRRTAQADLSATSAFDLRAGWDSGAVRMADLLALYPYENTLRAIRLSGAGLKAYLEQSARYFRVDPLGRVTLNDSIPGYNYDILGGVRYSIDLRRPAGDRITGVAVHGRPVQPSDSFTMAVNSYRQTGTGGYGMLHGARVTYDRGEDIRSLLASAVQQEQPLDPARYREQGWRIVPEQMAAQVRALFRLRGPASPPARRDTVLLRILATTDLHGHIEQVPRLKAVFDSLAAACGCPTLRLDGGDEMQGTLLSNATGGRSTIDVLNRLGLAAAVVGNHDLDWSVDSLRSRMTESRYPWVVANVYDSASGGRPVWAQPYRLLSAGQLTVAVVGYITADTRALVKADRVAGLRIGHGAIALKAVLDTVRARRPDLTVLLAHAGATCARAVCGGEIVDLAAELERGRVDLILAGHTHRVVETVAGGIPILEAGRYGQAYAIADVVQTPSGRRLRTGVARVDTLGPGDPALAAVVAGYRQRLDSVASRVIARIKLPLARAGDQHRVGALIVGARQAMLRTDVAIANNGGIRTGIPAGPVTFGRLYEVQPFGNGLVRLTLTGAQLRETLEHALADGRPDAHVAGVVVRYDPRRPAGRRIVSLTLPRGGKLRDKARYTLAADDFVAGGGDGYALLATLPREPAGLSDLDALTGYLRRLPQPVEVTATPGFVAVR